MAVELISNSQRGGIFFWILLALSLIGALTFAVSGGFRSNETMLTRDRANIIATEVMDYGNAVRQTVQKLILRGCQVDRDINFYDTSFINPAGYNMPDAPSDGRCHVFSLNGGGLNWQSPPLMGSLYAPEYIYLGRFSVAGIGSGSGTEGKELMMAAPVPLESCIEINNRFNMSHLGKNIPSTTFSIDGHSLRFPPWNWHMYGERNYNISGTAFINNMEFDGDFAGKEGFCFHQLNTNPAWKMHDTYWFLYTLVAR